MTSCRFSRWQISGILDFMNSKMGALKNLLTKLLSFPENRVFAFCRQDPRWRISAILDFRGLIMGSLKSPCTTSYWSSIETIALKCLIFQKIAFFLHFGDKQMDSSDALSRCRYRERRLNKLSCLTRTARGSYYLEITKSNIIIIECH